jgi:hypothetical protein
MEQNEEITRNRSKYILKFDTWQRKSIQGNLGSSVNVVHPDTSGSCLNPSYSSGRDQEDHSSKRARANSSQVPILKKPSTRKDWWCGSRCRPEFKLQYHKNVFRQHNIWKEEKHLCFIPCTKLIQRLNVKSKIPKLLDECREYFMPLFWRIIFMAYLSSYCWL